MYNFGKILGYLIATKVILVRSQIWTWEVKEWVSLQNLYGDYVKIWSELRYLIGVIVVWLRCRMVDDKTGTYATVRVRVWYELFQWFGSGSNLNPEPYLRVGTVANSSPIAFLQFQAAIYRM
jgi:hypothetical protein